jgi:predicted PurR-regulated permease PerM
MVEGRVEQETHIARAIETGIRLGAVFLLAMLVYDIVKPFLSPALWGIIIAVAGYPAYRRLVSLCGGREKLAAGIFSLLGVALLITPTVMLTGALVDGVQALASNIQDGGIDIPPPKPEVADWPFVGERVYASWSRAAVDLQGALEKLSPQIETLSGWLLKAAASAGAGVLQFLLSILIAGAVLANAEGGGRVATRLFVRLAPGSGAGFAKLAEQTVRSVAAGVIGVAVIQALLAGAGFFAAGVPGAAFLVLICLLLGVVQLPLALVMLPVLAWVWTSTPTLTAVLFTIWSVPASLSDNVLKPILLGRGVQAPMLVIFLGAIGGFVASGIIGLFIGAVILVLAYELLSVWLGVTREEAPVESG